MGDDLGSSGLGKSVRSFVETIGSLEKELELVFGKARTGSSSAVSGALRKIVGGVAGAAPSPPSPVDLLALLRIASSGWDAPLVTKGLARVLGLADESALDAIRGDVRDVMEQVAKLREREIALAGGVSQLRARAARFDEALAGLARVQGRYVARLDAQADQSRSIEQLAGKRDDHITRLIRDTVAQRAEIERLAGEIGTGQAAGADASTPDTREAIGGELELLRTEIADFRRLHQSGAQGVIDSLEAMRERVGKLEARMAEMSREGRAKGGRLDALARHVAGVENRLTNALGTGGKPVVAVANEMDSSLQATG